MFVFLYNQSRCIALGGIDEGRCYKTGIKVGLVGHVILLLHKYTELTISQCLYASLLSECLLKDGLAFVITST